MPKKFYITTAIDYVNSTPHIGTAYEKIAADAITRFFRMQGDRGAVFLQMGNDEHSVNVKKQADGLGLTPKVYCDQMRPKFEQTWAALGIQFDRFMQTSDKNHHRAVQHLFSLIEEKGYIYPGEYEGWYCESCEAFYTAKDLVDNLCPHHKTTPRWIKETNYFFKLSAFAAPLLAHIQNHPYFILPEIRRNEIVKLIEGGLQDISVSRSSFDWGVELPGHSGHVVYVWFDALINYLSGAGYPDESYKDFWPADLHIVGKDITRFHCVIWPAMLIAAELELPKTVFGHGFIALKGEKMSKSLGNVVGPLEIVEKYGADSLRYYLLREGSFGRDGNFTWENFVQRYNSDLANGLGNLVSRVLGMAHKYLAGQVEAVEIDPAWHQQVNRLSEIMAAMDFHVSKDFNFHLALEKIWSGIAVLDKFVDAEAPWRLAKENKMAEVNRVLYHCLEGLRVIAIELAPFLPQTAQKIWQALGLNGEVSQLKFADEIALQRYQKFFANQITGLFPRIVA